jgi:hypothetical protein
MAYDIGGLTLAVDIAIFGTTLIDGTDNLKLVPILPSYTLESITTELVSTTAAALRGEYHLLLYPRTTKEVTTLRVSSDGTEIAETGVPLSVGAGWDYVESFILGNQLHIMAYQKAKGIFSFFPILPDLTCAAPYRFFRNHDPGVTAGFATVRTFVAQGGLVYLGYNAQTGDVAMYTLFVTATSPPGVPPLASLCVWSHKWAPGWVRFAFFQWAGENFFLKTNVKKPNVNIDHVCDTLSNGTVEVGSQLQLKDAQELSIVEPFTSQTASPYFVTYKPDGRTTVNRFHGDGLGWTTVGESETVAGATHIVPIKTSAKQLFLFCVPR